MVATATAERSPVGQGDSPGRTQPLGRRKRRRQNEKDSEQPHFLPVRSWRRCYYHETQGAYGFSDFGRDVRGRLLADRQALGADVSSETEEIPVPRVKAVFLAEMEVAHNAGIPILAVDVWALKITAKGYPEVFRVAPNQALIASKYGDWIAAAGFKNVAFIYKKTDGGQSARDVLLPVLDKHGVKYDVVGADPSATEFTAQIERFKTHSPPYDFFMTAYSLAGAYPMISQSHTLGFAPTAGTGIANSGGPAVDPTFWKNVGEAGKYLVTEVVGLPKNAWNDTTKAFVAAFKKKYNHTPSPQAIENYDAMLVLADAIKRAQSTDGKAIIAALEKTDIVLGRGRCTFSTSHTPDWAYHQFMDAPVALIQYDKVGQDAEDAPIVWKGPGADSEEKRAPASDIDTVMVDSLKALDPNRPIREADMDQPAFTAFDL